MKRIFITTLVAASLMAANSFSSSIGRSGGSSGGTTKSLAVTGNSTVSKTFKET